MTPTGACRPSMGVPRRRALELHTTHYNIANEYRPRKYSSEEFIQAGMAVQWKNHQAMKYKQPTRFNGWDLASCGVPVLCNPTQPDGLKKLYLAGSWKRRTLYWVSAKRCAYAMVSVFFVFFAFLLGVMGFLLLTFVSCRGLSKSPISSRRSRCFFGTDIFSPTRNECPNI